MGELGKSLLPSPDEGKVKKGEGEAWKGRKEKGGGSCIKLRACLPKDTGILTPGPEH